jgi:hypothetical protein
MGHTDVFRKPGMFSKLSQSAEPGANMLKIKSLTEVVPLGLGSLFEASRPTAPAEGIRTVSD